jgi:hypothetical protein
MILRIDCYLMIQLLLGVKEWIIDNMWDIKRVLESQENTHNKVEVQANSESRSDFESNSESRTTFPLN